MSLLTYTALCDLVAAGVITGVSPDRINAASIDVTLGETIWVESERGRAVDLAAKETPGMDRIQMTPRGYLLAPGEFILAQTREVFHLPDDVACEFKLKSSLARSGLQHAVAGWADPGFHGSVLTLEYHNVLTHHPLRIKPGMPCGQMVFFRGDPVPAHASYRVRGQYCGDLSAQPSRGVR